MPENLELERFGARRGFYLGQLLMLTDMALMGELALGNLANMLALLFHDDGAPMTGFPADHCLLEGNGLEFKVAPGIGMFYDAALLNDEDEPSSYRPILVDGIREGTLAPHDPQARTDFVCLRPKWIDDQEEIVTVKDPATLAKSWPTQARRRRWGAEVVVVAGTPGEGQPALPADVVPVARATIPAATGAVLWEDWRPMLELGDLLQRPPGAHYCVDHIPGAGDDLLVEPTSPPSMQVRVRAGVAVVNGRKVRIPAAIRTVQWGPFSGDREDIVALHEGVVVLYTDGMGGPGEPMPESAVPLARILVPEGESSAIGAGQITDVRQRAPYGAHMVRAEMRSISIAGAAFVPDFKALEFEDALGDRGVIRENGAWRVTPNMLTPVGFVCGVSPPHGATLRGMAVVVETPDHPSSAPVITATLMQKNLTTGAIDVIATAEYDSGDGVQTLTGVLEEEVDTEAYAYLIQVSITEDGVALPGTRLHGARLTYEA